MAAVSEQTACEMAQRILMISGGRIAFDGGFDRLRELTGSLTRVYVTMEDSMVPQIENGRLLSSSKGVYEYEIDLTKIPIQALLYQLSQIKGVKDMEVKRAPIEQIIAELFKSWKENCEF
jgi:ABC-2 type transport system ATP-binding protein